MALRTVDDVFSDFLGRRRGIIKALTVDVRCRGGGGATALPAGTGRLAGAASRCTTATRLARWGAAQLCRASTRVRDASRALGPAAGRAWYSRRRRPRAALTVAPAATSLQVDAFSELCDPSKDNLCLYGYADGTWEVSPPCEEVPPELPEPTLGINFARDGGCWMSWYAAVVECTCWRCMLPHARAVLLQQQAHAFITRPPHRPHKPPPAAAGMKRQDWLCLVAVHADCWLMAMSFYNAAKIDQKGRQRLFEEINGLPTCFEIVSGRASGKPGVDPMQAAAKRAVRGRSIACVLSEEAWCCEGRAAG